jgi:hypothetical protein
MDLNAQPSLDYTVPSHLSLRLVDAEVVLLHVAGGIALFPSVIGPVETSKSLDTGAPESGNHRSLLGCDFVLTNFQLYCEHHPSSSGDATDEAPIDKWSGYQVRFGRRRRR